ncbi:hypothetical protein [Mycobacteroides abscessus]|uniref:hypothetical protein n=1 Tax=Mycobacteroides abscessus TaxID=36809 RepID=UPI000941163F|nr:hypothetical protein [Mycobacteroides abscessus]MBN7456300.1 hypothetical protein [Mycobacteroides abscessus subsp. abscessus]MBN7543793.1 hypothetical protein [Mycobacteroides abscessus subsp. abscessus]MBN7569168.1 hypothetical protein [Mycobacteroides abscessus subsp. abscessus]QSM94675.1 hypothetical protein I3U31_02200 [Mycobacteroides abscessus subsp. abscessus]QSM99710.1 hypothetical protein I3U40_02200 [Mycobacteroides abscessus subsp. abscessus]
MLAHRAGAVDGNESQLAADSVSTVPREGGSPEVEGAHFSAAVQTVRDFGAPLSHGAIRCASWCSDGRGHVDAVMRADQACWSASSAVVLGLADGAPALPVDIESWAQLDPARIAVSAYRAFHSLPVVDLHLYHPHENRNVHVDFNVKMTADEAVQLARFLLDSAALAGAGVADDSR